LVKFRESTKKRKQIRQSEQSEHKEELDTKRAMTDSKN